MGATSAPSTGKPAAPAKAKAATKRAAKRKPKPKAAASRSRSKKAAGGSSAAQKLLGGAATSSFVPPVPRGPLPTLILDTGGWTVKHGTLPPAAVTTNAAATNTANATAPGLPAAAAATVAAAVPAVEPRQSPNATAKLKHQLTVLTADEIRSVRNQSQLDLTHPLERGYPTNLGAQLRVWRRMCDVECIDCVSAGGGAGDLNKLLGMPDSKKKAKGGGRAMTPPPPIYASTSSRVVLLTQPFTPKCLSERVDEIWFRDLGFAVVGKILGQSASAWRYLGKLVPPGTEGMAHRQQEQEQETAESCSNDGITDDGTRCCLVVDSGFSLSHVVPTLSARAITSAVRRLNVGGRLLTNLLKEWVSYRQWNLMEDFHIVNEAKEALVFVSPTPGEFCREMEAARAVRHGFRSYDREFVLPDFVDTFGGTVRLAAGLRREKERKERETERRERKAAEAAAAAAAKKEKGKAEEEEDNMHDDDNDDRGDEDKNVIANSTDGGSDGKNGGNDNIANDGKNDADDDNDDDENDDGQDSDEETDAQRLRRIQRQRDEERRRLEAEEAERQALSLSVERFAVPEVLFRPDDVGIVDQGGLAETIVQAVRACPRHLHAAMYRNVLLTGGNALIPGFAWRLEAELRALVPANYEVRICLPDDPVTYAWRGAQDLVAATSSSATTTPAVKADGDGNGNRDGTVGRNEVEAFDGCFVDRVQWEASRRTSRGGEDVQNAWAKVEEKNAAEGMMIM